MILLKEVGAEARATGKDYWYVMRRGNKVELDSKIDV